VLVLAALSLALGALVFRWARRLRSLERRPAEDAAFRFVLLSLAFAALYLLQLFILAPSGRIDR
jgi:hypothetical protein